jgi:hypothetical protein
MNYIASTESMITNNGFKELKKWVVVIHINILIHYSPAKTN